MKKVFLNILSYILVFGPNIAKAQTNGGLDNINDLNLNGDLELINLIGRIINIVLGILGVLVLVGIIYGGFKMMTAAGNEEQSSQGKKVVGAGVIGLIIVVGSLAIANFVIAQLKDATGSDF